MVGNASGDEMDDGYTDSQLSFIRDLVDRLGYRESPLGEEFISLLTTRYCYSLEATSAVIDWLQELLSLRRNARPNDSGSDVIAISDLADYAFCPASYSIRKTFRVPPSIEMAAGERRHERKELRKFLRNVRKKRKREYKHFPEKAAEHDDEESFVLRGNYGDLLQSELIHEGHSRSNDGPFYGPDRKIAGNPDYVYERPDGSHIIVEEKHTKNSDLDRPWINHIIQVTAYVQYLEKFESDTGYIVYFPVQSHPLLFEVESSQKNRKRLRRTIEGLEELREDGRQKFYSENVRPSKCIGCSANPYCNHKSGKIDALEVPYRMMRTAKLPDDN